MTLVRLKTLVAMAALIRWLVWAVLLSFLPSAAFADFVLARTERFFARRLNRWLGILLAIGCYLIGWYILIWVARFHLAQRGARACEASAATCDIGDIVSVRIVLSSDDGLVAHMLVAAQLVAMLSRVGMHAAILVLQVLLTEPWIAILLSGSAAAFSLMPTRL